MKKTGKSAFAVAMVLFLLTVHSAALDLYDVAERLMDSSDYPAVDEQASEGVCRIINSLLGGDAVTPDELDWTKAYKIYTMDTDIYSLPSCSKTDILTAMDDYIWFYPAEINGRPIRVTVSRALAPEHSLVDQGVLSEHAYQSLVEKTGTWTAPEGEIDTLQTTENIQDYLENAGVSQTDELIFVGGSPRIRSLTAITFTDGQADKLIPLAHVRQISTVGGYVEECGLQVGQPYRFSAIAQMLQGGSSQSNASRFILPGAGAVLVIASIVFAWKRRG